MKAVAITALGFGMKAAAAITALAFVLKAVAPTSARAFGMKAVAPTSARAFVLKAAAITALEFGMKAVATAGALAFGMKAAAITALGFGMKAVATAGARRSRRPRANSRRLLMKWPANGRWRSGNHDTVIALGITVGLGDGEAALHAGEGKAQLGDFSAALFVVIAGEVGVGAGEDAGDEDGPGKFTGGPGKFTGRMGGWERSGTRKRQEGHGGSFIWALGLPMGSAEKAAHGEFLSLEFSRGPRLELARTAGNLNVKA